MNRLKELRIANGYKTQQELASALFVNQTAVSQWERGITMPSGSMLLKLSKMYGVSTDYILGNSDEVSNEKQVTPVGRRKETNNVIRIAGRDGSIFECTVSDSQRELIKQMLINLKPIDDKNV